jgi:DNA-binding transcriptional LysR family regulator
MRYSLPILVPGLEELSRVYPGIQLELTVHNSYLNLSHREADIAIRTTSTPPETLVGRRLGNFANTVYLKKTLERPPSGTSLAALGFSKLRAEQEQLGRPCGEVPTRSAAAIDEGDGEAHRHRFADAAQPRDLP